MKQILSLFLRLIFNCQRPMKTPLVHNSLTAAAVVASLTILSCSREKVEESAAVQVEPAAARTKGMNWHMGYT